MPEGSILHQIKEWINEQDSALTATEALENAREQGENFGDPTPYHQSFNMEQYGPGTVFRLQKVNGRGETSYDWYAIGKNESKGPIQLYGAIYKNDDGMMYIPDDPDNPGNPYNNEFLKKDPHLKIDVVKAIVTNKSFEIKDANEALWGDKSEPKREITPYTYLPKKIDLFVVGTKEGKKRKITKDQTTSNLNSPLGNEA